MILACQHDSYVKELSTKVVLCEPIVEYGIDKSVSAFDIILEDTILFPGGGGQPKDKGFINGIPVDDIEKRDGEVYHRTKKSMAIGSPVKISLYWPSRFDHMQQHTGGFHCPSEVMCIDVSTDNHKLPKGQHLLTALSETLLQYSTTSWNMGTDINYIELDTPDISVYNMEILEQNANSIIRDCIPVTVEYYERDDPALCLISKRLELPESHFNPIRVVRIVGVDANTCCGTHVRNTSELQAIKLLYTEKSKKGRTKLFFAVGDRVLKYLRTSVNRERHLTKLLGCSPEEHPVLVELTQNNLKNANKELLATLRDVAVLEAKMFKMKDPLPIYYTLHRSNGTLDFMNAFLREVDSNKTLFILTVGVPRTGGHMIMSGPLPLVDKLGPLVCSILDGMGTMQNGKFQAKIKLVNLPKIDNFLLIAAEQITKYFAKQ